jgi:surface polysaccharide O-acyltransferase-like enzyme
MAFAYLQLGLKLVGSNARGVEAIAQVSFPLHIHLAFYFVLGLVVGVRRQDFELRLKGRALHFLLAALVLGALALVEAEMVYRATSLDWRSSTNTLPTSLYALAIIFLFLAITDIPKPVARISHSLATKMLGIYFVHSLFLEFVARATQKLVPGLLAYTVLFQLVLVTSALAGSMLIMEAGSRSPLRRYYKYVFG